MLEMYTQFLKHLRNNRGANVYRAVVCAKHFVSIQYTISPIRRILVVIENEKDDLTYIGASI